MLAIQDLEMNKEMTKEAMVAVFGGGHGIGNYSHVHNRLLFKFKRSFTFRRYVGCKAYKYRQTQWTWKRIQVGHAGKLKCLGQVCV